MTWMRIAVMLLTVCAAGPGVFAQITHPWEVAEMTFEAHREYTNSYMESLPDRSVSLARATFRGTSGAAREMRYTLPMFWDGSKTWKARFAPPAAGEWTWSTASQDPGLDGATGKIQVVGWTDAEKQANPARRGFIRVSREGPQAGRYFET